MHSSLYFWGLGERPFHPNRIYRISKVLHNMWYTFLGVFQYTIWEAIFMYCWATKRLPFMTDSEAISNLWNFSMVLLSAFWVPLYREVHFYFAHRYATKLLVLVLKKDQLENNINKNLLRIKNIFYS